MAVTIPTSGATGVLTNNPDNYNMAHEFYIGDELLPWTPASFTVKGNDRVETFQLANDWPVTVPQRDGVQTYSFTFKIPLNEEAFMWSGKLKSPRYYTDLLWNLKSNKKPTSLTIIRHDRYMHSYSVPVLLTDYSYTEDAEQDDAFEFDVTFIDYYAWHNMETDSGIQHHLTKKKNARGWQG